MELVRQWQRHHFLAVCRVQTGRPVIGTQVDPISLRLKDEVATLRASASYMGADRLKMAANALLWALESCQGTCPEANTGILFVFFLEAKLWENEG